MTAVAYGFAGLYSATSLELIPWIVPSIAIGVPLGAFIIRHAPVEIFRRVCLSFDAWIVGFGLSRLLNELRLIDGPAVYLVLVGIVSLDIWMYRFFTGTTAAGEGDPDTS
jgi:hypothetical protein